MTSENYDEMTAHDRWRQAFPDLPGFFFMYLNDALFEEMGQGNTTPEILNYVVEHRERPYIEQVLQSLACLIPLVKTGGINLKQFLEDVSTEKMRDYDNKSNLEWVEDIQKMLRENYTKKYGKTA